MNVSIRKTGVVSLDTIGGIRVDGESLNEYIQEIVKKDCEHPERYQFKEFAGRVHIVISDLTTETETSTQEPKYDFVAELNRVLGVLRTKPITLPATSNLCLQRRRP